MDRLLLYPTTHPIPTTQTRRPIPLGGGVLELWTGRYFATPQEPEAFVLEFTGNGGRAEGGTGLPEDVFARHSLEIWVVNYPGYGGSTGPAKLASIAGAADAAYQEIQKVASGRPVFLYGTSMGTTAALYLAARYPVRGVIVKNPPPLRRLIFGRYGWWNLWLGALAVSLKLPKELDSLQNAQEAKSPSLFLMAQQDTVVPIRYQEMIYHKYAGAKQKVVMPGFGHNDWLTPEARASLADYFSERLASP